MKAQRIRRRYNHRCREVVHATRDIEPGVTNGAPRSSVSRGTPKPTTTDHLKTGSRQTPAYPEFTHVKECRFAARPSWISVRGTSTSRVPEPCRPRSHRGEWTIPRATLSTSRQRHLSWRTGTETKGFRRRDTRAGIRALRDQIECPASAHPLGFSPRWQLNFSRSRRISSTSRSTSGSAAVTATPSDAERRSATSSPSCR
jgi:hypothetical protein